MVAASRGGGGSRCPSFGHGFGVLGFGGVVGEISGGLRIHGAGGQTLAEAAGLAVELKQMAALGESVEQRSHQAGVDPE